MAPSGPGLNALIAQCRRLEVALRDEAGQAGAPDASAAMHRFVAEMDARAAPPGLWSPLALAVLTMVGGIGVGIGLLSLLLRPAGPALAAFALVLLKRTALALATAGVLGLIAWSQGDMRAVGPVVALLGGAGAWLLMNSNAFYVFAGYRVALRVMQAQARRP